VKELFRQLSRRHVFRVGAIYALAAWIMIQVANNFFPALGLPVWTQTLVAVLVLAGFPFALLFAWAFALTPDGMRRATAAGGPEVSGVARGRHVDRWIIGALLLVIGYFAWDQQTKAPSGALASVDVSQPVPGFSGRAAIAVLPFVNMSGDPEQEYFADGMTEDVITGLQSFRSFPVIARTSTFTYKGKATDVRDIARELGAGYVLEGSVRKSGDRVRVTAQLIGAEGKHLWAENYDRDLTDLLKVQDEITQRIILAIEPEIMLTEIDRSKHVRTTDLEAWDYFLRAQAETNTMFGYADLNGRPVTVERNEKARRLAQKAIELDPNFARAYTLLAHIEGTLAENMVFEVSEEAAGESYQRALGHAKQARAISPFDATACSCQARLLIWGGEFDAARRLQEEALRTNPSSAHVHAVLGDALKVLGHYDRALEEFQIAKRLSPKDMNMSFFLGLESETFVAKGDFPAAIRTADRALTITPLAYHAHISKIISLYATGQVEESGSALKEMLHHVPGFNVRGLYERPVPESLAAAVEAAGGDPSQGQSYPLAITAILRRVGWEG
jgi:TolB-like protein